MVHFILIIILFLATFQDGALDIIMVFQVASKIVKIKYVLLILVLMLASFPCLQPQSCQINLSLSFEPALKNVDLLRKHVKLNNFSNKIYIENILLGEKNLDEVNFFQDKNPTGMNSIVKNKKVNLQLTKVKQVSLDFYLNKKKYKPDIIKIDVEGAEINVLLGAKKSIKKFKPVIYLSVHPSSIEKIGQSTKMLMNLIKDLNYSCYEINGAIVKRFYLREYKLLPNS